MNFYHHIFKSPIGDIYFISDDTHLRVLAFKKNWSKLSKKYARETLIGKSSPVIDLTIKQLKEYWAGKRTEFSVPFFLVGTEFQKKVWTSLLSIPFGETASYQTQAEKLKTPLAIRAVAGANGANPISLLLPCHRVIGKDGSLTGYAGGIEIKEYLLKLEKAKSKSV